MKPKTAKHMALLMLIVSALLTLALLACAASSIPRLRAIPPTLVLFLFAAYFGWIDTVYLRCIRALRGKTTPERTDKLGMHCIVLSTIMGGTALCMCTVLCGSAIFVDIAVLKNPFMLYFGGVGIGSAAYTLITLLIFKALHKAQ